MYDTFMLITGIIFIILAFIAGFTIGIAFWVTHQARKSYKELMELYQDYQDAKERANETVVEKFRHDLDCHNGELS